MLQAVPDRPISEHTERLHAATVAFASAALMAKRAEAMMRAPLYAGPLPPEKLAVARMEARQLIKQLMPVADMPELTAALRVLHEVRRELGRREPDLVALRRNLTLYLDGAPEGS